MQDNQEIPANPHITIPNPFEDYQKSLEQMNVMFPELQEISRICYEFFLMSHDGKKLWELLEDKYIMGNNVNPMLPNSEIIAMYWTGFTDCLKFLRQQGLAHKQRVNAV